MKEIIDILNGGKIAKQSNIQIYLFIHRLRETNLFTRLEEKLKLLRTASKISETCDKVSN